MKRRQQELVKEITAEAAASNSHPLKNWQASTGPAEPNVGERPALLRIFNGAPANAGAGGPASSAAGSLVYQASTSAPEVSRQMRQPTPGQT